MRTLGSIAGAIALLGILGIAGYEALAQHEAYQAMILIAERMKADGDANDVIGPRDRIASDDSIAAGSSWKVNCGTIDGGTSTDLLTNVDGGKVYDVSDYTVTSSSTTCVNVGLNSFVDTAHGVPVGSGCNGGTILSMHARLGRCRSTGAVVTVDVTGGRQ